MKVKKISIPSNKRVICVSDIHGELDLFKRLLDKVKFNKDDYLILLGDLYTKGSQCHETLKYCISICDSPNVYALWGNADWHSEYLSKDEIRWIDDLPHIIDAGDYVFVHSGLSANYFSTSSEPYMKYNNFMETATKFEKWVVVGHWPVSMYCHGIPCSAPIVNEEKNIISVDGGNVIKSDGQLNAFIIEDRQFSFESVDNLPTYIVKGSHTESGGSLNITWLDRFVELVEDRGSLCLVRHLATGTVLTVPKSQIWTDTDGKLCCCDLVTDYHLPCNAGDEVSVVEVFNDRIFAKANSISGWINETTK